MKYQIILTTLAIFIVFSSCKKEEDPQLNVNANFISFSSDVLSKTILKA